MSFRQVIYNLIIPAGKSKNLHIKFAPKTIGSYTGKLIINHDPCDMLDTITITGNKEGIAFVVSDSLDFGAIIFCKNETTSLTLPFTIENRSSSGNDGIIKSPVQISNPFSTTLKSGDPLPVGVLNTYNVTIAIDSIYPDGDITGILDFVLSPCDSVKTVKLKAKKSTIKLTTTSSIDFDTVEVGSYKDDTLRLKNTGTAVIVINSVDEIAPYKLIETKPALPASLKPNDTLTAVFRFTPTDSLLYSANIVQNVSDTCNPQLHSLLTGYGKITAAKSLVIIDSDSAQAGDKVKISLRLINSENLIQSGESRHFESKIRFNSTLLEPLFESDNVITNGERIITISDSISSPSGVMKEMEFIAGLGNAECTNMIIDTVIWQNRKVNIETKSGQFCLLNVCHEGGDRLIDPNSRMGMRRITPNPANDCIDITLSIIETGYSEIVIYNIIGEKVKTLFADNVRTTGVRQLHSDISDLATGQFTIVFKTPTYLQRLQLLILK